MIFQNIIGFMYLATFLYLFWGAYNIISAGYNREQARKGKVIMMQSIILYLFLFGVFEIILLTNGNGI